MSPDNRVSPAAMKPLAGMPPAEQQAPMGALPEDFPLSEKDVALLKEKLLAGWYPEQVVATKSIGGCPMPKGYGRYEPLRTDLRQFLEGGWIHHPLYVGEVRNADYCGHIHTTIDARQRRLTSLLTEGRYDLAVMTHEKPYRLEALEKYATRMDDALFWKTFAEVWQMSDNLWQYQPAIRRIMDRNRPCREEMMTAEERHAAGAMPDPIPIYRGYTRTRSMKGWSWTTDPDKAEWFARRFAVKGRECFVAEGTVSKQYVIAFFTGRNESEIVVDPRRVVVMTTRRIKAT